MLRVLQNWSLNKYVLSFWNSMWDFYILKHVFWTMLVSNWVFSCCLHMDMAFTMQWRAVTHAICCGRHGVSSLHIWAMWTRPDDWNALWSGIYHLVKPLFFSWFKSQRKRIQLSGDVVSGWLILGQNELILLNIKFRIMP